MSEADHTGGRSLGRNAAVMAGGTAASRVFGLLRAVVLVAAVGSTSYAANAFNAAYFLPNVIYMLVAGGVLNAVLVPQIARAYRSSGGDEYVDRLLTVSGVVLFGVTATVTLAAPLIVWLTVGGVEQASDTAPGFTALTLAFALWCLPQVFFYGVYTLLGQVLNARGNFGPYMWAPVLNNVVAIAGIALFVALYGRYEPGGAVADPDFWTAGPVAVLAGTSTLAVACQALVLVVPLRRMGFRFRPRRGLRGVGLGTAGRVAGWTFAALAIGQLGVWVVIRITTGAAQLATPGDVVAGNALYNYAFTIFMLPHSLITVSLVTALYTRLSHHAAADDVAAVRTDVSSGLRTIGVFTVFATVVLAVLALPVSRMILIYDVPAAARALTPVVVALSCGLVALGAWALVQRVYYAYEDARSLFRLQVPMAVVVAGGTWLASLVLPVEWWTAAAGAAIAASYVLGAARGGAAVRRRLGGIGGDVVRTHVRAGLAAVVAAAVGWPLTGAFGDLSRAGFVTAAVACAVVGLVMLGVYLAMLRLLHVRELEELAAPLLRRVGPRRSMSTPVAPDDAVGPGEPAGHERAGRHPRPAEHGGDRLDAVVIGRGTLLAGRYRLEEPLGEDAPGAVRWLARDQILDRLVDASILQEGRVVEAQDAARRAALVTDPRLVRVLDVGDHDGAAYVVTERVTGHTLEELTAYGPIGAGQARAIIGEAAVALDAACRRGVHHLALRPSSVHVTADGRVVVSGLAMDGELAGTDVGDARSAMRVDAVGLVSLLYLALTGRWPAPAGAAVGTAPPAPVVDGSPVPPAELAGGVPNDLDTLCSVTLGPHDDGPHTPGELVSELEPWRPVDGQALLAALDAEVARERGGTTPSATAGAAGAAAGIGAALDDRRHAAEDAPRPDHATSDTVGGAAAHGRTGPLEPVPTVAEGTAGPQDPVPTVAEDGTPDGGGRDGTPRGDDAATSVQRQPVRATFGSHPPPASPPGTPPPAIPPTQRLPRPDARRPGNAPDAQLTGPAGAGAAAGPAGVDPATDLSTTAPVSAAAVRRNSVSVSTGARPLGSADPRPGTVPLVRDGAGRPAGAAGAASAAVASGSTAPTTGPPDGEESFDQLLRRSAAALTERSFNPTPFVLLLVLAVVVIGGLTAWQSFTAPAPPIGGANGLGDLSGPVAPLDPAEEQAAEEAPETAPEGEAVEPEPAPAAPPVQPVIAGGQQLDPPPDGDQNEHPEAVDRALDGDPSTFWFSRTYASPTYGMKDGIGYAVTLAEPATVTQVTLDVNGAGGAVELRATDPATPTEGPVLASGPLAPQTVLTLPEPTVTQHLVLWFPALPQTPDGRNRIEITEITVS